MPKSPKGTARNSTNRMRTIFLFANSRNCSSILVVPKKKGEPLRFARLLAEWTGLEPATPGVTGRYSNQLNYHSILLLIIDSDALDDKPNVWLRSLFGVP